jgi:hypothetical protein
MFCPTCGRDNSVGRKFCASCGTNLGAVYQALSGGDDDFFTKIDTSLDNFLARYAEHVFKNAPSHAAEQRVGRSWQVLGQSVITSFVDALLFFLMWNVLPLRFLMLLVSTPVRLLSGREKRRQDALPRGRRAPELAEPAPQQWLPDSVGSVTDHTTMILPETSEQKSGLKTTSPK